MRFFIEAVRCKVLKRISETIGELPDLLPTSTLEVRVAGPKNKTIEVLIECSLQEDIITDIEGNYYHTVKIGDQRWMAENLRTTKYNEGSLIPNIKDNSQWGGLASGAYCWHNNDLNNKSTYGALYNGYAVNTNKLCPSGWHVSTREDWYALILFYDHNAFSPGLILNNLTVGGLLKETGTTHWQSPNEGATNVSGFTALPGDFRTTDGWFGEIGYYAYFWTATPSGAQNSWGFQLCYNSGIISWGGGHDNCGESVRCIKNY